MNNRIKIKEGDRLPLLGGILLTYSGIVFIQNTHNWNLKSVIGFFVILFLHAMMYVLRKKMFIGLPGLYFFMQGVFLILLSLILKSDYQMACLGLMPMIIAQSIQVLRRWDKILLATFYYYAIYILATILYKGIGQLLYSISLFMLISSAVVCYGYLYLEQVKSAERAYHLYYELESAYDRLEEVTRESEREKLARDIHDTLSQELVGVLMLMENKEIAPDVIAHVRHTLRETRGIIQGLREKESDFKEYELMEGLCKVIDQYRKHSEIPVDVHQYGTKTVSPWVYKNCTNMLREILANVKKHARAGHVMIQITLEQERIWFSVEDNGIGFDWKKSAGFSGHYGLIGLSERAKALGGTLQIDSYHRMGTKVTFSTEKGGPL